MNAIKQELQKTPKEVVVSVHPEWRKHLTPDLVWGVYSRDCYGLSKEEISKLLIKTFEDYGEALDLAQKIGEKTAIHLTQDHKDHNFDKR